MDKFVGFIRTEELAHHSLVVGSEPIDLGRIGPK